MKCIGKPQCNSLALGEIPKGLSLFTVVIISDLFYFVFYNTIYMYFNLMSWRTLLIKVFIYIKASKARRKIKYDLHQQGK